MGLTKFETISHQIKPSSFRNTLGGAGQLALGMRIWIQLMSETCLCFAVLYIACQSPNSGHMVTWRCSLWALFCAGIVSNVTFKFLLCVDSGPFKAYSISLSTTLSLLSSYQIHEVRPSSYNQHPVFFSPLSK